MKGEVISCYLNENDTHIFICVIFPPQLVELFGRISMCGLDGDVVLLED